jgi:hypothetical protein
MRSHAVCACVRVCVCMCMCSPPHLPNVEKNDHFSRHLVWTLWYWRPPQPRPFQFPTIDNNMVDARTSEVEVTLRQLIQNIPKICSYIIIRNINLVYISFWDTLYMVLKLCIVINLRQICKFQCKIGEACNTQEGGKKLVQEGDSKAWREVTTH